MNNGQIDRIRQMEQHLDAVRSAVAAMTEALRQRDAAREAAEALDAYYGSGDHEAGLLPRDLPRGVLSEDGIWNVLADWRRLNGCFPTDE